MIKSTGRDRAFTLGPWAVFPVLLAAETALSYFQWSLSARLLIVLWGLVLPLSLLLLSPRLGPKEEDPSPEKAGGIPFLVPGVLLITLLSILFRFQKWGRTDWWPGGDESLNALEGIGLYEHWRWVPFTNISQIPTTLSYLCCGVLKAVHSTLLGSQTPPALISLLTLWAGFHAVRVHFSRPLAWIFLGLMAFHYWLLQISGLLLPGVTLPLWELGTFFFLGRWLGAQDGGKTPWACALGLCLGLGPYTFFPWPVLSLWVLGLMAADWWNKGGGRTGSMLGFLFFWLLALTPFLSSISWDGYGGYLSDKSILKPNFDLLSFLGRSSGYFSALFWGGLPHGTWSPSSGGFFNVILSSCLFIGIAEWHRPGRTGAWWLTGALGLSLLPGILSLDLEFHRILLALPILLFFSALGLQGLVGRTPVGNRSLLFFSMLLLSCAIDGSRYAGTAWNAANEQRDFYKILREEEEKRGPGYVLADMVANPQDRSLSYSSYFLNAAFHPPKEGTPVRWAAVFTERQYQGPLAARFPASRWWSAPLSPSGGLSRHVLGLIPLEGPAAGPMGDWKHYFLFKQDLDLVIMDLPSQKDRRVILERSLFFYPTLSPDPFLQSLFFEKLLFNYSWEKNFHPEDQWTQWSAFAGVFKECFEKSYQDVNLCAKYGDLLAAQGETTKARETYRKALRIRPGDPWLLARVRDLGSGGK